MARAFVFVHGHDFKPAAEPLLELWSDAIRAGLTRDFPEKAEVFDAARKDLVYFGDHGNALLSAGGRHYDERLDIADRRNALARLAQVPKPKKFNRYNYENLPGKSSIGELLADMGAPLLGKMGLGKSIVTRVVPELATYWQPDSEYREQAVARARARLSEAMASEAGVMVIAHGLGAVVTYDALWALSHGGDGPATGKVDQLLTLGCPLADDTVRGRLAGHGEQGARRYPTNIVNWYNIAAEDDYICHDKTVSDDFRAMLDQHLVSVIDDFRIYNLTVRYGRSNPHSALGYLIHPRITKLIAEWL